MGRWVWRIVAVTAAAALLVALLLELGSLIPVLGVVSFMGGWLVPTFAPLLVVVGACGLGTGLLARRGGARHSGRVLAAISALVVVAALMVSAAVGVVGARHGARVDPVAALLPGNSGTSGPDERPVYATPDGQELHASVYRAAGDGPAPTLVWVHGGGFVEGETDATPDTFRWYADQGWTVVSLEYRLARPGRPTWDLAPADVACGLGWVQHQAAELKVDPTRVALGGESAGGTLALLTAQRTSAGPAQACGRPVAAPAAVIDLYGPADLAALWTSPFRLGVDLDTRSMVERFTGGTPAEHPERYRAVSPATAPGTPLPPTLVIAAGHDHLVDVDDLRTFVGGTSGDDVTLVGVPFVEHGFDLVAHDSLGEQTVRTLVLHHLEEATAAPAP